MKRHDSVGKAIMLGKVDGRERRGALAVRWIDTVKEPTGFICKDTVVNDGTF